VVVAPPDAGLTLPARPAGPPPAGAVAPYTLAPDGPRGTMLGTITVPVPPPRALTAPTPGPAACPGSVAPAPLRIASNAGLDGAVVWLELATGKAPPAPASAPAAELIVSGCAPTPRGVRVAAVGGKLAVENADPVRHEVVLVHRALPDGGDARGELGRWPMPLEGQRFELVVDTPGVVEVVVDGATRAIALVPPHPYWAVTDNLGRYRFDDVPPGKYALRVWHPAPPGGVPWAGRADGEVVAGEAAEVNVAITAPAP
jgi:hypothetical protein